MARKTNEWNQMENRREKLVTILNPRSPISESYRTLRTNMQFASVAKELKTVLVTSAGPAEGKSTTIANFAVVNAQANKKVLLIDADLRKPKIHQTFRISNRYGLTTLLASQCTESEAVIASPDVEGLYILPSGTIPPNPAELLGSQSMKQWINHFREQFDLVLIDTPPVLAVTDAQVLSTVVDGVVLVAASGKVSKDQAQKAKEALDMVQANIVGVVLNQKKIDKKQGYYYYYGE